MVSKMNQQKESNFISKLNPKPDGADKKNTTRYQEIEKLASISHDAWHFWSQSIMRDFDELVTALNDVDNRMMEHNIGYVNTYSHKRVTKLLQKHNERNERWQKQWCPYAQLPEEVKESDRIWAKKEYEAINK
jgi:hypothetical protein